jgi:hypothetical protein
MLSEHMIIAHELVRQLDSWKVVYHLLDYTENEWYFKILT